MSIPPLAADHSERYSTLLLTTSNLVDSLGRDSIAYIQCDSNNRAGATPNELVSRAAARQPDAIILFTIRAAACNITGDFGYQTIYTMTDRVDADSIFQSFQVNQLRSITARIAASTGSSGPPPSGPPNGPAPTTAVAMSILYAITGIITLLFLVIISTGVLRARRNPDRYGPRVALGGRTRQSRAKGLARAMLETLPIVKFGDPEPTKDGSSRDVELADTHTTPPVVAADGSKQTSTDTKLETPIVPLAAAGAGMESGLGTAESRKSDEEAASKEAEVECSICTEAFSAGDDVRVLPCQHKFHPACIDPWLLNVSGTCPLCRHDLNPTVEGAVAEGELPPPIAPEVQPGSEAAPERRRMSRFLDPTLLRVAPPAERIAALRQLREASRNNGTGETSPAVEESSNSRQRLRDRFRRGSRVQPPTTTESTTTESTTTESTPAPPANETPR